MEKYTGGSERADSYFKRKDDERLDSNFNPYTPIEDLLEAIRAEDYSVALLRKQLKRKSSKGS